MWTGPAWTCQAVAAASRGQSCPLTSRRTLTMTPSGPATVTGWARCRVRAASLTRTKRTVLPRCIVMWCRACLPLIFGVWKETSVDLFCIYLFSMTYYFIFLNLLVVFIFGRLVLRCFKHLPVALPFFLFMCLLSPCSCSKCLVIIVTFSWMSALPLFGQWRGEVSRESKCVRVKPPERWRGGGGTGLRDMWGLSFSCLIFRCISGMGAFCLPCSVFLLCWFLHYLLSNIAHLTYIRAQLQAQMPLLPDDRAEWKQDIKMLIFLYYFCLRNMDLDVIHFWNAFQVNLIKSNLRVEIIFCFVQLSS